MFAVIKTGGKQYRVVADDVLKVAKVEGEPGAIVQFGEVLVVGGDSVTLGEPAISGASVAAEVLEQARGPKVIAFKKRRRKNSRRKRGHRQEFTLVRITEILTDGATPNMTPPPRAKRAPKPAPVMEAGAASDDGEATPSTDATPKAKKAEKSKSATKAEKPKSKSKK
jgi:large subunit ribosomal protein L21